ncbi:MAG: SDR family NAD(P)-dependent oxidoreductase [Deltaproteobacteria bacterium]|nr:SDR family NAD(P)-dependent oxidoreductase [Deltaproteobacteria bacterium]
MEKTAIITGAGRGIGRALACGLAADGFNVVLISRNEPDLEGVKREIAALVPNSDSKVVLYPISVTERAAIDKAVSDVIERYGAIDVLINNAGINYQGTWQIDPARFEEMLAVNTLGPFNMMHAVVPQMKKRGSGYIINVASICAVEGFEGVGAYSASKFALLGFNESLYRELSPLGIKVTALCPSWTNTDMAKHSPLSDSDKIQPADVLEAVRFLLKLGPSATVKELVIGCAKQPD